MKRIFAIILSTVLLLGALVACGTTPAETTPTPTTPAPTTPAPTTPVVTPSTTPPTVPPPTLRFRSLDELRELKSMLEKDDATVKEYLRSKNYYANDLESKEDIHQFFETYGNLNMLLLDSSFHYDLYIVVVPCMDYVEVIYSEGGSWVIRLTHLAKDYNTDGSGTIAFTIEIGDEAIDFYCLPTDPSHFTAKFIFGDYVMLIQIHEPDIADADLVKSTFDGKFIITTLNELIEK